MAGRSTDREAADYAVRFDVDDGVAVFRDVDGGPSGDLALVAVDAAGRLDDLDAAYGVCSPLATVTEGDYDVLEPAD